MPQHSIALAPECRVHTIKHVYAHSGCPWDKTGAWPDLGQEELIKIKFLLDLFSWYIFITSFLTEQIILIFLGRIAANRFPVKDLDNNSVLFFILFIPLITHPFPSRSLQHPNILQCLGLCTETIPFLLIMEFCQLVSELQTQQFWAGKPSPSQILRF